MTRDELIRERLKAMHDDAGLLVREMANAQLITAGYAQEQAMRLLESAITDARAQVRRMVECSKGA